MPLSSLYKGKGLILRLAGVLVLLFSVLSFALTAQPASAGTNIDLQIDPSPSNYILNDGTDSEYMWWQVTFDSTPLKIVQYIVMPDGVTKFDLHTWDISSPDPIHASPQYNPEYNNTAHPWFSSDITDAHVWNVPLDAPAGTYKVAVEYYNTSDAVNYEKYDSAIFYVHQFVAPATPAATPTTTVTPPPTVDPPSAMSVGGIAEFPVGGSNSSSPPYAVIIGGAIAALAVIALGGWFARRRWLRRYS